MPKAGKQPRLPFTPVRKLFTRPKSEPLHDYGPADPVIETPPHVHRPPLGSVALQNDDIAEDAVVITALDSAPFCCHEDLLAMTHAQLVSVASALNAKLPSVLAISLDEDLVFIRNSIELIVGLRRALPPPPAPKASRIYNFGVASSPPSSPCARLSLRGTPRLNRLDEVDERQRSPTRRQRPRTVTQPRHDDDMQIDELPAARENERTDVYGVLT